MFGSHLARPSELLAPLSDLGGTREWKRPHISSAELQSALGQYFKFQDFRTHQEEVVNHILAGHDVFVTFPTGDGKSVCFQLPAQILHERRKGGVTVVFTPTISLMEDQIRNLKGTGITAAYIHSQLSDEEKRRQLELVSEGKVALIYVAPERLRSEPFMRMLEKVGVNGFTVDEAHCLSEWGHDFRPTYMLIKHARRRFGNPPVAAFTATAPVRVRDDIVKNLDMQNPFQLHLDPVRANLSLKVEHFENQRERRHWLFDRLAEHRDRRERGIVYCTKISTAKSLYRAGLLKGFQPGIYHGDMEAPDRRRNQKGFDNNEFDFLVATKSFGMGVNKRDIRFIYHSELPSSAEGFLQEAGRAGRDGKHAQGTILFHPQDVSVLRGFIVAANPVLERIEKAYRSLVRGFDWKQLEEPVPERDFREESWLQGFTGDKAFLKHLYHSALTILQEHGAIEISGGKLRLLITPKMIKRDGFPITEHHCKAKYDHDVQKLKIILEAVTSGEPLPQFMRRYFSHNSVIEEVDGRTIDSFIHLHQRVLTPILQALMDRDFRMTTLCTHLTAKSGITRGIAGAGELTRLTAEEVRFYVEHAASLGFVRLVKLPHCTVVTSTERGIGEAREDVINPAHLQPSTKLSRLGLRLHNPLELQTLIGALSPWFEKNIQNVKDLSAERKVCERFISGTFVMLGEKVTGRQLVNRFRFGQGRYLSTDHLIQSSAQMLNYLFSDRLAAHANLLHGKRKKLRPN